MFICPRNVGQIKHQSAAVVATSKSFEALEASLGTSKRPSSAQKRRWHIWDVSRASTKQRRNAESALARRPCLIRMVIFYKVVQYDARWQMLNSFGTVMKSFVLLHTFPDLSTHLKAETRALSAAVFQFRDRQGHIPEAFQRAAYWNFRSGQLSKRSVCMTLKVSST